MEIAKLECMRIYGPVVLPAKSCDEEGGRKIC
jgi:hypothetical protein